MKREIIREYTILYQYILLLKEPLYIFLVQVFQHLAPAAWWEDFIEPVLNRERKENFYYLDISDLLNVFKMNLGKILKFQKSKGHVLQYDETYGLVNKVHRIRTIVAHANDVEMSPFVLVDSLASLLDFSRVISAGEELVQKLEVDWLKHRKTLPEKLPKAPREALVKERILSVIEEKVLLKAVHCETLPADIKLSVDRTIMRLHSMRTLDEVIGFFNNAIRSERGIVIEEELHRNGLSTFDDIKNEINELYELLVR
jgi:hypothetical protein